MESLKIPLPLRGRNNWRKREGVNTVDIQKKMAYETVQSFTGGTVTSFQTASHARSLSKPSTPLITASAIRESACVPIYHECRLAKKYRSVNGSPYHDTGLYVPSMIISRQSETRTTHLQYSSTWVANLPVYGQSISLSV